MDTIARVGRDPVRKLQSDDRLIGPAKLAYRYGVEPTYLIQGCAAALSFAEQGDSQAAELQKLIKERSVEYSLDFVSQLRPWNPISKLIRDELQTTAPL
jgi:mannitol-1-phosphate 5-dehydrogenase